MRCVSTHASIWASSKAVTDDSSPSDASSTPVCRSAGIAHSSSNGGSLLLSLSILAASTPPVPAAAAKPRIAAATSHFLDFFALRSLSRASPYAFSALNASSSLRALSSSFQERHSLPAGLRCSSFGSICVHTGLNVSRSPTTSVLASHQTPVRRRNIMTPRAYQSLATLASTPISTSGAM